MSILEISSFTVRKGERIQYDYDYDYAKLNVKNLFIDYSIAS